jgi:nucleoside-diphosphate-sugar epimerase
MIAVTGANGLLGSYTVRRLVERNLPFVAIRRKKSDTSLLADIEHAITWREADVLDYESLVEAFKDVTGVIHSAAVVSYHKRDRDMLYAVNVAGTKHVVNVCLQLGVNRLLHVSSVAALGKEKGQQLVNESSKWIEGSSVSNYADSKYKAELEVWRGQEEGLSTVVVNPSVILAPSDWDKSSAQLFKYAWQQRPFYTDGAVCAVDVRDVADCIVRLYESSIQAERFILTGEKISYFDFFKKAATNFQKRPPFIRVGKPLLQVAAWSEAIRGALTGSVPLVTKETAQLAGRSFTYSNEKVKKTLGIEFQSIESSIQWCCEQYMKKIGLKN